MASELVPFSTVSPEDGGEPPVRWAAYIHACGTLILVSASMHEAELGDVEFGVCHECPEAGTFRRVYVRGGSDGE